MWQTMHWLEGMDRVNVCFMGWPACDLSIVGSAVALVPECPNAA